MFCGFGQMCSTCVHHCNIIQRSFTALKILCALPVHTRSQPLTLVATCLLTVSIVLPSPECCRLGLRQYVAFSD